MLTQDKVARIFDAGNFERAFFIYRNELAPIGDKYAQYMVGYMFLTGTGVQLDPIAASAWYRLAAERGTPEFIAVRDQQLGNMDEDAVRRSDAEYYELRLKYCDLAVLLSSVRRNLKEVEARTGTRIPGASNNLTVVQPSDGRVRSGSEYYGELRAQIEDRLKLLQEFGGFEDMETDPDRVNFKELERLVMEKIRSID